jgi:dipeptide/tripeptide permease
VVSGPFQAHDGAMTEEARKSARIGLWFLANVVGAAIYLWLSSKTWIEPVLRGAAGVSRAGDAAVWGLSALPVFVICMAANFVWSWRRHWRGQGSIAELLIFVPWVLAFGADRLFN